ncbi:MAG: hypothetical protein NT062_13810 [Proteobacteria bacterium]|nr:hypothetical protein [Pseudomonadota bacterium]
MGAGSWGATSCHSVRARAGLSRPARHALTSSSCQNARARPTASETTNTTAGIAAARR